MFDALLAPPSRNTKVRSAIVTAVVAAHAAALAALAIAGMWDIDKLEVERTPRAVASFALPGDSGGGGAPQPELVAKKPEPEKRKVKVTETVQPEPEAADPADEPAADAASDGGDAAGTDGPPGNGTGGDGQGFDTPTGTGCTAPPCGIGAAPDPRKPDKPEPPKPSRPETIAPNIAAGLRIGGNDQISAPESVRVQMLHQGKSRLIGTVTLCIDTRGRVSSARVVKSTGFDAYDARLLSEMRAWRYKPYTVNGRAAPACTAVTVVYKMAK